MDRTKTPKLEPAEERYLRLFSETTTVPDMAKYLKRGPATIYAWMKENGLEPYRAPKKHRNGSHPWRAQNRALEMNRIFKHLGND